MDGEQAKVHSHHSKTKHRGDGSARETEATSPTETTTAPTTKPIVIVQSLSNNDEMESTSPASSTNVNSKIVHLSAAENVTLRDSHENLNEINDDKLIINKKSTTTTTINNSKYSPMASPNTHPIQKATTKSLSDPTASPARRSLRSRNSNEKSPRQKRSKSESRRRRERKLIAAGEMEVRQANETLMRYLKQCSEITDASLSGELEIDKSIDDRFHRKMKSSHRDNGHRSSNSSIGTQGKLWFDEPYCAWSGIIFFFFFFFTFCWLRIIGDGKSTKTKSMSAFSMIGNRAASFARERLPPSGLSNILQELTADIIPNHDEIYNPFTPVVSPTEGPRTDKMFIQTPRGFRSVSDNTYLKTMMHDDVEKNQRFETVDDGF